jgi:FtsH-binding integral membrane protein
MIGERQMMHLLIILAPLVLWLFLFVVAIMLAEHQLDQEKEPHFPLLKMIAYCCAFIVRDKPDRDKPYGAFLFVFVMMLLTLTLPMCALMYLGPELAEYLGYPPPGRR